MTLSPANSSGCGYPLALAGAVAATRYVGGTTSGAPASGTFAVGDFVVTQDGSIYICTVAGSPGTWAAVSGGGGGGELAYAEVTSDTNVTSTTAASPDTIITAGAVSLDGSTTVIVECFTAGLFSPGGAVSRFTAVEVTAAKDGGAASVLGIVADMFNDLSNRVLGPALGTIRLTPAAGSWVYRFCAYVNGGTGVVSAGAGGSGNFVPAYIRVVQV